MFYKGETDFLEFNTQNGEIGVYKNHIPLTTELAEWPDEIDVDRAQAAKERAEQRLSNHTAEIDVKRADFRDFNIRPINHEYTERLVLTRLL